MPPRRIRLVGVAPGAAAMRGVVREFAKKGGIVTATSDRRLRPLRQLVGNDAEVELIPFGDAVGKLAVLAGGQPQPMVQKGHARAAVAEAFQSLPPGSLIAESGAFPATHRCVAECISELRAWRISSDDLFEASRKAKGVQSSKLAEIATIYRDCMATFAALGRDQNAGRLEACFELEDSSLLGNSRLLVVLGSEYEPLTCDWLLWLSGLKAEVVVVIEGHETLPGSFEGAAKIEAHLGVPLTRQGEANRIVRSLLAERSDARDGLKVVFSNSPDMLAETEWALRAFLKDAEERPLDGCALLVRNLDQYAPMVESAARRLGVPLRSSRRVPLLSNGFAKLIIEAIEACAESDIRSISRLARSTYFESEPGFREHLDVGIRASQQDMTQQWQRLAAWAEGERDHAPWLALLLAWREEAVSGRHPMSKWIGLVRDLGVLPWTWDETSHTGSRDDHAQTALQRMLAQVASIENVRSKRVYSLEEFARRVRTLASDADTSVPETPSGVLLVSSAEELGDCHSLTVLGMLEGVFPKRRSEDPVLNDQDRRFLSEALNLKAPLRDSHEAARAERDELLRVCAAPTQLLTLSYPLVDDDRDNIPAFWLKDVETAAGDVERIVHSRTDIAPTGAYGRSAADTALAIALAAGTLESEPPRLTEPRSAAVVRGDPSRRYELGELRDAFQCPFRYWARRRAGLQARREARAWERLSVLPQRAKLAVQPTREAATRALEQELEKLEAELEGLAASESVALLRAGGERLIKGWVDREFRARELWPRSDVQAPVSLGEGGLKDTFAGTPLRGSLAGLATFEGHTVATRYRLRGNYQTWNELTWRSLSADHRFDVAFSLSLIPNPRRGLELDSAEGQRTLIATKRRPEWRVDTQIGLRILDLTDEEGKEMATEFKRNLASALESIESGSVEARPSEDNCSFCGYGELCRRHMQFGESGTAVFEEEEEE